MQAQGTETAPTKDAPDAATAPTAPADPPLSPRRLLHRAAARPRYSRTLRDLNPALLAGFPQRQGLLGRLRSWAAGLSGASREELPAAPRRRRRR